MDIKKFLQEGSDHFLQNLSIDLVIMGYDGNALKCLLLKIGEKWLLPGGYIGKHESVDHATNRILMERTGIQDPYFKFLSVFGNHDRSFASDFKQFFKGRGMKWKDEYFINNRFVTLAYYSFVDINEFELQAGEFIESIEWFDFDSIPDMWLDHQSIVLHARDRIKEDLKYQMTSYKLLPEEFTMPQLHQLHQVILEEKLDRSRFQKNMLSSGMFERLPMLKKNSPGRNPYLYKLKS